MPRRKAISRCSTSKESPARSAGSRRCWRIAFPPRSSRSMPTAAARSAATTGSASPAPAARPARRSGASAPPIEGGGRFEGYTDPAETEKKILRDVFAEGDAWFRTGDLMRLDEQGFFHFVDRVGDTFRWKGENVATSEVNDAIRDCPGVLDATDLWRRSPGRRRPRRHGGDRRGPRVSISGSSRDICRAGCRSMRFRSSSGSAARSTPPRPSSRRSSELIREGLIPRSWPTRCSCAIRRWRLSCPDRTGAVYARIGGGRSSGSSIGSKADRF